MTQQTVVADVALLGKMAGYIETLVKDPASTVFVALSDIYRAFSLHDEAIAVAQRGCEMLPTYVPGFVALGRALAEKGDPAAAGTAYRRALALDPVNLPALTGLASSALGCGEREEARSLINRAQLIAPEDDVVRQLHAVVAKLIHLSPAPAPSPVPRPQAPVPPPVETEVAPPAPAVAVITEEAEEPAETAPVVATPPPIATATLADIYIKQGFYDKALKVFGDLLNDDPGNAEIRQRFEALQRQLSVVEPVAVQKAEVPVSVQTEAVSPVEEPVEKAAPAGKEALIALYERWLDAVNQRRADVYRHIA